MQRLTVHMALTLAVSLSLVSTVAGAETSSSERLERGRVLANQCCSVCHMFPEPDLLTQATWQHHTLSKMAPFLGVTQVRMENRPDAARLQVANLFPPAPFLPRDDLSGPEPGLKAPPRLAKVVILQIRR